MDALCYIFRCLRVVVVTASMTASPVVARPAAGCSIGTVEAAAHPECYCGNDCRCEVCPCMQARSQAPPQPPAIPPEGRELVKLQAPLLDVAPPFFTAIGAVEFAPGLLPAASLDFDARFAAHLLASLTSEALPARLASCWHLSRGDLSKASVVWHRAGPSFRVPSNSFANR